jgi:hypothetical protein
MPGYVTTSNEFTRSTRHSSVVAAFDHDQGVLRMAPQPGTPLVLRSRARYKTGVWASNATETELLVILKHFGPKRPDNRLAE